MKNSNFEYTDKCREISGFGGGYEKACRSMVIAGMEWVAKNGADDLSFSGISNVFGLIIENNQLSKDLTSAMLNAVNNDATGAMMQGCVNHVLYAAQNGWDKYISELEKGTEDDGNVKRGNI